MGEPVKIYAFNYDPAAMVGNDWLMGLQSEYWEKADGVNAVLDKLITWTRVQLRKSVYFPGDLGAGPGPYTPSTQMTTQQTIDGFGNVVQMKIFDYGNHTTPMRTYTNTIWDNGSCGVYHICNRIQTSQVTDGSNTVTLVFTATI